MKYDDKIGSGFKRWSEGEYSPGQIKAFKDYENYFILLSGSYRSGKSEIGCRIGVRHCMFYPNAKFGVFRKHLTSLKRSTLLTALELIHPNWLADWSNSDLIATFKNGSTIQFLGIDSPDKIGSIELTGGFIDEAHETTSEDLGMIQGRLSGKLVYPSNYLELPRDKQEYLNETIDKRQVFLACNPKSENHFLFKDFIKNPKPNHTHYVSNSISNPNLPINYIISNLSAYLKPGYSLDWIIEQVELIRSGKMPSDGLHLKDALTPFGQRNMLALWVALEGAIYVLDEDKHYLDNVPEDFGTPLKYYGSLDFGFHNPRLTVFRHYKVNGKFKQEDRYAVVHYWAEKDSSYEEMLKGMEQLTRAYNISNWYLPPDQPAVIKQARDLLGRTTIKKAKNNVSGGILTVSGFLNKGNLVFLRAPGSELCWQEMNGYTWKKNRDGIALDEPEKENDHFPDAIRYLLFSRHGKEAIT